jgi:hypothetical protein
MKAIYSNINKKHETSQTGALLFLLASGSQVFSLTKLTVLYSLIFFRILRHVNNMYAAGILRPGLEVGTTQEFSILNNNKN